MSARWVQFLLETRNTPLTRICVQSVALVQVSARVRLLAFLNVLFGKVKRILGCFGSLFCFYPTWASLTNGKNLPGNGNVVIFNYLRKSALSIWKVKKAVDVADIWWGGKCNVLIYNLLWFSRYEAAFQALLRGESIGIMRQYGPYDKSVSRLSGTIPPTHRYAVHIFYEVRLCSSAFIVPKSHALLGGNGMIYGVFSPCGDKLYENCPK